MSEVANKPQKLPAHVEAPFAAACAWDEMLTAFDRIRQACEGRHGLPRCEWEAWDRVRLTLVRERMVAYALVAEKLAAPDGAPAGRLSLRKSYAELINQVGGEALAAARRVNGGE